jgi:hypothetical protein
MNRHVQIIHIIADVLLFGTVAYIFSSKMRRQTEYIQHLESKIHYLHEKISQIETSMSKIYVHYVSSATPPPPPPPTVPLPVQVPQVQTVLPSIEPLAIEVSPPPSERSESVPSPPPSPTLSSELNKHQDTLVVDYTKDPIDREIFEELQEVESYQSESN